MELVFLTFFLGVGILSVIPVSGHTYTSSYTLVDPGLSTEIDYYLKPNEIYGSVISPGYEAGSQLRVGQAWQQEVGDKTHLVDCEILEDAYLDEYEPVIHYYGNPPEVAFGTFILKQVWNCTTSKNMKTPPLSPINFYRVVNKMHGVRPVNTIFYFDGIEVILDTTAAQPRQDHGPIWTASFKEIKYLDPTSKNVLRYDGKLHLSFSSASKLNEIIFTPVDVIDKSTYMNEPIEEFGPTIDPTPKKQIFGKYGEVLRVGKSTYTTLGSGRLKDEATCELRSRQEGAELPLLYTENYLPLCSVRKPNSADYIESYGKSGGRVSSNCFSIINQEEWLCRYQDRVPRTHFIGHSKEWKTFNRRVTELVAAIPIAEIEYFGAVSVWKYKLNSKSTGVKIREVYYYQGDVDNQIRYNGKWVSLTEPDPQWRVDSQEVEASFYTYNPNVISDYPKLSDEKKKKPVRERRSPSSGGGGAGGGWGGGGGGYGGGGPAGTGTSTGDIVGAVVCGLLFGCCG